MQNSALRASLVSLLAARCSAVVFRSPPPTAAGSAPSAKRAWTADSPELASSPWISKAVATGMGASSPSWVRASSLAIVAAAARSIGLRPFLSLSVMAKDRSSPIASATARTSSPSPHRETQCNGVPSAVFIWMTAKTSFARSAVADGPVCEPLDPLDFSRDGGVRPRDAARGEGEGRPAKLPAHGEDGTLVTLRGDGGPTEPWGEAEAAGESQAMDSSMCAMGWGGAAVMAPDRVFSTQESWPRAARKRRRGHLVLFPAMDASKIVRSTLLLPMRRRRFAGGAVGPRRTRCNSSHSNDPPDPPSQDAEDSVCLPDSTSCRERSWPGVGRRRVDCRRCSRCRGLIPSLSLLISGVLPWSSTQTYDAPTLSSSTDTSAPAATRRSATRQ
mmetsp:Transcript_46032/g.99701  ORF Transcript_46032/g.99701 Transcript_46032/m.99701 type:complete len:388 (+) Transcript_46032:2273-3436(+)